MDHCHHQRSPLRPRHTHRLSPILSPLDPPFPFLPYPHILPPRAHAASSVCTRPPRAHRAKFPAVPCAPEAFSRTRLTSCARGGGQKYVAESEPAYGTRFTRGRKIVARRPEVAGAQHKPRPCHLQPLRRQPTPLSHMDSPPFCSALRHPVSKGWGIFVCFSTYLLEALPLHGFLRHHTGKRLGCFSRFSPIP